MKFRSTRGDHSVTFDEALIQGIADDGGLYLPESLPDFIMDDFEGSRSIAEVAKVLLTPFLEDVVRTSTNMNPQNSVSARSNLTVVSLRTLEY